MPLFRKKTQASGLEDYEATTTTLRAQNFSTGSDVLRWAIEKNSFPTGSPQFEAAETVAAEIDEVQGSNRRLAGRFVVTVRVNDPTAATAFVPLGELLYDRGEMAGPYDERVDDADFASNGLRRYDPGPQRLFALAILAEYAKASGHARFSEWRAAALQGAASIRDVPVYVGGMGDSVKDTIDKIDAL